MNFEKFMQNNLKFMTFVQNFAHKKVVVFELLFLSIQGTTLYIFFVSICIYIYLSIYPSRIKLTAPAGLPG